MKLVSNGITVEAIHPADIAFFKKAGYREIKEEPPEEVVEIVPQKPKNKQPGKNKAEKAPQKPQKSTAGDTTAGSVTDEPT